MGEVRRGDGKRNVFWRWARNWPAPAPVHTTRRALPKVPKCRRFDSGLFEC